MPRCRKKPPYRGHKKNRRLTKLDHLMASGQLPNIFANLDKLDSVEAHKIMSDWLEKNPKILGHFQRYLNRQPLNQQKEKARQSGNLRRLRILENGSEPYSVTQVLLKYGKDCHICKTPIDLKASRRVGIGDWLLGLHIDHLIPVVKGGSDTLDNVRPSHAICNLKKGIN